MNENNNIGRRDSVPLNFYSTSSGQNTQKSGKARSESAQKERMQSGISTHPPDVKSEGSHKFISKIMNNVFGGSSLDSIGCSPGAVLLRTLNKNENKRGGNIKELQNELKFLMNDAKTKKILYENKKEEAKEHHQNVKSLLSKREEIKNYNMPEDRREILMDINKNEISRSEENGAKCEINAMELFKDWEDADQKLKDAHYVKGKDGKEKDGIATVLNKLIDDLENKIMNVENETGSGEFEIEGEGGDVALSSEEEIDNKNNDKEKI